jgi:GntR family transcriptional regulator
MRLDRRGGVPLYVQIREALSEEIAGMQPGSAVATENELERRFGVSRITVRKAIDDLVVEGLLERQQGRGTFVRDRKLTHELNKITSWTEQLKTLGYEPGTTHAERAVVEPPRRVSNILRLGEGERVVRLRRLRLADNLPVSIMVNYLPEDLVPGLVDFGVEHESLYEHLESSYGLVPATAIDTVEAREADEQEAELLKIEPWSPVISVTRIGHLDDGTPLEVALVTSRGDKYQYKVALSGRAIPAGGTAPAAQPTA